MILKQFADSLYATTAEMVDIISITAGVTEVDQAKSRMKQIFRQQSTFRQWEFKTEFFIDLVTTVNIKVIALDIKEQALDKLFRILYVRGVTGTHAAVDLFQSFFAVT